MIRSSVNKMSWKLRHARSQSFSLKLNSTKISLSLYTFIDTLFNPHTFDSEIGSQKLGYLGRIYTLHGDNYLTNH